MRAPSPADKSLRGDILLVDDQSDVVTSIGRVLKFKGYKIRTATSVAKALKFAKERLPGLLLTDIIMPGRSGIELARDLRQMSPGLPVVFMTGYADAQQEAGAADPVAILVKPVEFDELFTILDRLQ